MIGDKSELMRSMSEVGLINPHILDDDYIVREGTRKYYSTKNLGSSRIRCDRRIGLSDYQKLTIEIDEKLRRKNLNPTEEAKVLALKKRSLLRMLDKEDIRNFFNIAGDNIRSFIFGRTLKTQNMDFINSFEDQVTDQRKFLREGKNTLLK